MLGYTTQPHPSVGVQPQGPLASLPAQGTLHRAGQRMKTSLDDAPEAGWVCEWVRARGGGGGQREGRRGLDTDMKMGGEKKMEHPPKPSAEL